MNINDLLVDKLGEPSRRVSESELLGLAVQLLKQRGAVEIESVTVPGQMLSVLHVRGVSKPGRYLVVPLSVLEDK